MSCSLWRWTEECDHRPCCGDCDYCSYGEDEEDTYTVTEPTVSVKGDQYGDDI